MLVLPTWESPRTITLLMVSRFVELLLDRWLIESRDSSTTLRERLRSGGICPLMISSKPKLT